MKILIVDDEAIVRAGIRSLIDWEAHGYSLIGEASNGIQALDIAKKLVPDIVLVDIAMPEMDGLELIKNIARHVPSCAFIILSGYDEINYYKKAISLGVKEYILKSSANASEILQIVERVADEIRKERVFDSAENNDETYINKFTILSQFLNMVLKGKITDPELIRKKLESFNIKLHTPEFHVLALFPPTGVNADKYCSRIQYAVSSLCQEVIDSLGAGFSFINYEEITTIIISYKGTRTSGEFISDLCRRICQTVLQCFNLDLCIGVSLPLVDYKDISRGYIQAGKASSRSYIHGKPGVYTFRDDEPNETDVMMIKKARQDLMNISSASQSCDITAGFERLRSSVMLYESITVPFIQQVYTDIIYHFTELFNREGINPTVVAGNEFTPQCFVQNAANFPELHLKTLNLISEKYSAYRNQCITSQLNIIGKIQKYVSENISEKITLKDISAEVHMNPEYVCRYFKSKTGNNLFDYINAHKIEIAKDLLLKGNSISQIVQQTGFSSQNYFIRVFKNNTGMTPGQFLKQP